MNNKLESVEKEWEQTFNALPDLITILDKEHKVVKVNKAMADRLEVSGEELKGKHCYEAVHGTECPIDNCPHALLLIDGVEHTSEIKEDNLGGYFLVTATPIIDEKGFIQGSVHVARDITKRIEMENDLRHALDDKEMLIKEIHHRVKNNLMIISSLLNLQSSYIEDEGALDVFRESENRANAMAKIHERLYQSTDLKNIDFGEYIQNLTNDLYMTMVSDTERIKMVIDVEDVSIDINTVVPLGLILNELVTNSMKYAFPPGESGYIKVELHRENENIVLKVSDNGVGIPEDVDYQNTSSLGLQLVDNLTMQVRGELDLDRSQGTTFTLTFKETS